MKQYLFYVASFFKLLSYIVLGSAPMEGIQYKNHLLIVVDLGIRVIAGIARSKTNINQLERIEAVFLLSMNE